MPNTDAVTIPIILNLCEYNVDQSTGITIAYTVKIFSGNMIQ